MPTFIQEMVKEKKQDLGLIIALHRSPIQTICLVKKRVDVTLPKLIRVQLLAAVQRRPFRLIFKEAHRVRVL